MNMKVVREYFAIKRQYLYCKESAHLAQLQKAPQWDIPRDVVTEACIT